MGRRRRTFVWVISKETLVVIICVMGVIIASSWQPSYSGEEALWPALGMVIPANSPSSIASAAELTAMLKQVAKKVDASAVNARVDPIWRLIPGLNGVRLNIDETVKRANLSAGGVLPSSVQLVFDQVPPAVNPQSLVAQPIYRGNPSKRQMALMFNVAWGTEYVPQIINILKKYHVHATFFLDGSWTKRNPAVAKEILAAGMELGNHAYNHPLLSRLSRESIISQIVRTNDIIKQATGAEPLLFAPPAGDFSDLVVKVAAGREMSTILWTLDTIDWKRPQPSVIFNRVVNRRTPGAMVLMHPTAPTVAALPSVIQALQKDGYQLVTVSSLLSPVRPVPKTLGEALEK